MSHPRDSTTDAVNTDETESPCKKTRGSPSSSSSSEIGQPFFKTKLCCNFRAGNCPYVASVCRFAHTVEDLRRPPPIRQETRGESGRPYKGRLCNKFNSGEGCPYGESCTFLHDEVPRNREGFAISLGHRGGYGAGDGGNVVVVAPYWKTRICNKWEISGFCPFGTNCNFAHGASGK